MVPRRAHRQRDGERYNRGRHPAGRREHRGGPSGQLHAAQRDRELQQRGIYPRQSACLRHSSAEDRDGQPPGQRHRAQCADGRGLQRGDGEYRLSDPRLRLSLHLLHGALCQQCIVLLGEQCFVRDELRHLRHRRFGERVDRHVCRQPGHRGLLRRSEWRRNSRRPYSMAGPDQFPRGEPGHRRGERQQ